METITYNYYIDKELIKPFKSECHTTINNWKIYATPIKESINHSIKKRKQKPIKTRKKQSVQHFGCIRVGISGGIEAHRGLREQRLNRYPQGPLAAVSETKGNFERKDVVDNENMDF